MVFRGLPRACWEFFLFLIRPQRSPLHAPGRPAAARTSLISAGALCRAHHSAGAAPPTGCSESCAAARRKSPTTPTSCTFSMMAMRPRARRARLGERGRARDHLTPEPRNPRAGRRLEATRSPRLRFQLFVLSRFFVSRASPSPASRRGSIEPLAWAEARAVVRRTCARMRTHTPLACCARFQACGVTAHCCDRVILF